MDTERGGTIGGIINTLNSAHAIGVPIPKVLSNFAHPESISNPNTDNPNTKRKTVATHLLQTNSYFNLRPLYSMHYKKLNRMQFLHTLQTKAFSQEATNAPAEF